MKEFLPGMYMHHEMVNGKGYPQGLTGDEIPMQAKIISVADTFDAMTIDRPYSKGMDLPAALERIRELVGTRYESVVCRGSRRSVRGRRSRKRHRPSTRGDQGIAAEEFRKRLANSLRIEFSHHTEV